MDERTYEAYKRNHEFTTVEHIHYEFNSGIEVYVKIERLSTRNDATVFIEITQADHVIALTIYNEEKLPAILQGLVNVEEGEPMYLISEIFMREEKQCL